MKNLFLPLIVSLLLFACNEKPTEAPLIEEEIAEEEFIGEETTALSSPIELNNFALKAVKYDDLYVLALYLPDAYDACNTHLTRIIPFDKSIKVTRAASEIEYVIAENQDGGEKIANAAAVGAGVKLYTQYGTEDLYIIGEDDIRDEAVAGHGVEFPDEAVNYLQVTLNEDEGFDIEIKSEQGVNEYDDSTGLAAMCE